MAEDRGIHRLDGDDAQLAIRADLDRAHRTEHPLAHVLASGQGIPATGDRTRMRIEAVAHSAHSADVARPQA